MMKRQLSTSGRLTTAAANVFAAKGDEEMWEMRSRLVGNLDPFVQDGSRFSEIGIDAAEKLIRSSARLLSDYPDLVPLAGIARELMVVHEGLGVTLTPQHLVASAFTAALERMYYLGLPQDEAAFRDLVVKNLEALKLACGGQQVEIVEVVGLTGLNLPDGRVLDTPWGKIRGVNQRPVAYGGLEQFKRAIRLVLCVPRRISIPIVPPPVTEITMGPWKTTQESQVLGMLALAFLLAASKDARAVPIAVWSTTVQPFAPGGSYTLRYPPVLQATWPPTLDEDACARIEGWCRLLEERRQLRPGASLAGARLVSAISERTSSIDSLVDTVIAWENIVGSEGGETTFRVTAALAKLIEDDPQKRTAVVQRLKKIYTDRSKAVHGVELDAQTLKSTVEAALDIGVTALQRLYKKDKEWLELDSSKRSERLLLREP